MSSNIPPVAPIRFDTREGRSLLHSLAQKCLPYDPHDLSLDVTGHILEQKDVFLRTACGAGKTGIIALLAYILPDVCNRSALVPTFTPWYNKDPVILVLCPTDTLELDIEHKLKSMGVQATALNLEILKKAQNSEKQGAEREIWDAAKSSRVILLSLELLSGDRFHQEMDLDNPASSFQTCCSILIVDEVHMVWLWGPQF
ncbi:hypothetical protein D9758_018457 [Tetrapyrgos nigripes]|uniref:DEAD/DEAH-box helicase domain-containing protein n=1 Tax=Tetrapyrgos nigripes TaxID=182062 RepID=A0A8H5F154_9AGAR|nr:hypothetical protein D9758_018457 [Tetrapyrgos nigripes]